jgi:hypothetical protein
MSLRPVASDFKTKRESTMSRSPDYRMQQGRIRMKRKKSARRTRRQVEERTLVAAIAGRRFVEQTTRMLGKHYANKYGVRRGR